MLKGREIDVSCLLYHSYPSRRKRRVAFAVGTEGGLDLANIEFPRYVRQQWNALIARAHGFPCHRADGQRQDDHNV